MLDLDLQEGGQDILPTPEPQLRRRRSSALQRGDHGTVAAYGQGCRCGPCRAARRAYDRAWHGARQVMRTGELRRLVSARDPARHLTALLAAGMTVQDVADAVPCAHATLDRILASARRGRGRCWSSIADRLAELAEEASTRPLPELEELGAEILPEGTP